jgi:hypothetical protein
MVHDDKTRRVPSIEATDARRADHVDPFPEAGDDP